MNDGGLSVAEDQAPALQPAQEMSAGALLRQAREAQDLNIGALAVALKVPVRKLEALEADRFDLLPDTVFTRALAASVCRTLKVEAEPILARLPVTSGPRLMTDEAGINTPFRAAGEGSGLAFWDLLSRPLVLAVLALLLGVVVLLAFPFAHLLETPTAQPSGAATEVLQSPAPAPATQANEDQAVAGGTALPAPLPDSKPAASDAPAAVDSPPVAAPAALPSVAGGALDASVSGAAAGASGLLILQAQGPSWIEVVDARGVVQARKIMAGAEVLDLSGTLPFSVVLGRADAVAVQVRGKPFDVKPFTKNNVARFEVK